MSRTPVAVVVGRNRKLIDTLIIVTLVLIAFVLRFINYSNIIAYPDEFTYYYRALATLSYNWAWSKQFMLDQPPIYMYLLSVTTFLYSSQLDTFRMLSVVFGSLTAGVVYLLGKAIFNRLSGVVAAILFTFSGFDILYSRLAQQESLTLLLITTTLYFFWIGVMGERRNIKFALVGGVFLGLAIDTKYIALMLPVTFVLFFLLIGRNWTHFRFLSKDSRDRLFSKEFFSFLIVGLLFLVPIIIDQYLNGVDAFYWDLLGKFASSYSPFYRSFDLGTILTAALSSYSQMLTFVSSFQSTSETLFPAYEIYTTLMILALFVLFAYYIRAVLKGWKKETFVFLLFIVATGFFFLYPTRFQYYQLYTFPAFPLMFARLFDRSVSRFGSSISHGFKTIRPLVLLTFVLLSLVLSMGIAAGVTSAKYGQGANDGLITFFQSIKAQGYQNVTIAVTPINGLEFVTYYLDQMNISANVITLEGIASANDPPNVQILEAPLQTTSIYSEVITLVPLSVYHPQYVVLGQDEYQIAFTTAMKMYLAQNYTPMMSSQGFIIFQRSVVESTLSPSS